MEDPTDVLCENVFGGKDGSTACTAMAQEKLLGYSLKCMLDNSRQEKMKDGRGKGP